MQSVEHGTAGWYPRRNPTLQSTALADGTWVIYDPASSMAHVLNVTAGVVWEYCDGRHAASQLGAVLAEYFPEVTEAVQQRAVVDILATFARAGLVLVPEEDPQPSPDDPQTAPSTGEQ